MESNRDEALRCAELAAAALANGELERAKRLAAKSRRLFPNKVAENVSAAVARAAAQESHASATTESGARRRRAAAASSSDRASVEGSSQKPYTEEQRLQVVRVLRSKSLYEVLDIKRDADESQVKKAYRLFALKLHPDKNSAPKADEAFKRVSHAFQVLSDADRRARYDQIGDDGENTSVPQRRHGGNGATMYTQEFSPEEIFEMFFGNGMPSQRYHHGTTRFRYDTRRRHGTYTAGRAQEGSSSSLFTMIPLFVLVLVFSLLSAFPELYGEKHFSLQRFDAYRTPKRTLNADVKYYVKRDFDQKFTKEADLRSLERDVEYTYASQLASGCQQELLQERRLRDASQSLFTSSTVRQKYRQQLENFRKTKCDELARLKRAGVVL
mmetsp:Transcript_50/g.147  ORF Transcript_50/g.147 Transcript_50/m.147 type:complete len:384 (+) Transcript_50:226-1377(+)